MGLQVDIADTEYYELLPIIRWQGAPNRRPQVVSGDRSVMTYTGHTVLQTLIR